MNAFQKAIENIAANVPGQAQGDYINPEDGLLYCGKCHTRKQYRVSILGAVRAMPVMCDCARAELEANEAAVKRQKLDLDRQRMRTRCFADTDTINSTATFAVDDQRDKKISAAMRRYADQWDTMREKNIGLLLHGPVGTGKSFYAACIANALLDREKPVPVLMTSLLRIINAVQGTFDGKQEVIDNMARFPLLILDDVGTERSTEYALEQVYNIIDARYRAGKPLIVTTNTPLERIINPSDLSQKRIYSRLLEMCQPIKVDGTDRRRDSIKKNYEQRMSLLGL